MQDCCRAGGCIYHAHMKHGAYIVLEGPDGGGSTTHAQILCETLTRDGIKLIRTAEPTTGPIGITIREQLRGKGIPANALQMLYSADRAWHMAKVVLPALEAGNIVIGERCQLSTFIYGEALGLDVPWLERMNEYFIQPDLLFILMPPFSVCQERLGIRDRDLLEEDSLQKKVYALYEQASKKHPAWITIDTSGDTKSVAQTIASTVKNFLSKR